LGSIIDFDDEKVLEKQLIGPSILPPLIFFVLMI